jgi:hypothetical protein
LKGCVVSQHPFSTDTVPAPASYAMSCSTVSVHEIASVDGECDWMSWICDTRSPNACAAPLISPHRAR